VKLSIVIPFFNEEKNVLGVIERLAEGIDKYRFSMGDIELVCVDNGSLDGTRKNIESAIEHFPFVKCVIVERNTGYGNGIARGLKAAQGEFVGWTHGDIQTDPIDVLRGYYLLQSQSDPERSFAKGNRYGRPLLDVFLTIGMGVFETVLFQTLFWDINAQPNVFERKFLNRLLKRPPLDFSFDLYAYYLAKQAGYSIVRFPVLFWERKFGSSKWNTGILARWKFIKRTILFSCKLRFK